MTRKLFVAVVGLVGLIVVASSAGAVPLPPHSHDEAGAAAHTHGPDGMWLDRRGQVSSATSWDADRWADWNAADWDGKSFATDQPDLAGLQGLPQFHFIYLYGKDGENRFAEFAAMFQADALQASGRLEALGRGLRFDLRAGNCFQSGQPCVDITVVKAKQTTAQLTKGGFNAVSKEVSGFKASNKKYAVWLDAPYYNACGQAHGYQDTVRGPANLSEGRTLAVVYQAYQPHMTYNRSHPLNGGFCRGRTLLHELGHNMGAVLNVAPNAYGGHCDDTPEDIMCYQDADDTRDYGDAVFDYNNDDYWDPIAVGGFGSQVKLAWWTVNLSKYVCPPQPATCAQPNTPEY